MKCTFIVLTRICYCDIISVTKNFFGGISMKKILALILSVAMLAVICVPFAVSADDKKAIDITDTVSFATAVEMYEGKLPIVRDDAIFLDPYDELDYTNTVGSNHANRTIYVSSTAGWTNYSNDEIFLAVCEDDMTSFVYPVVWAGVTTPLQFEFTVTEEDDYEIVVVGCAQIKEADVNNDKKDRGFCVSIDDNQELYQVNAADTKAMFRDYAYNYSVEKALAGIKTDNGTNSQDMQFGYWYNIVFHLTKGKHVFKYYNLQYSGNEDLAFSTSSRFNYAGAFVQKSLSESELKAYEYPVITTEEETTAEETPAEVTTAEITTVETTAAQVIETTAAATQPVVTTAEEKKPEAKSGCGSVVGGAVAVFVTVLGTAWIVRKKH